MYLLALSTSFTHSNTRIIPLLPSPLFLCFHTGQEPFAFDFNATLPSGYIEKAQKQKQSQHTMTAAEIKRRTHAEDLRLLMGSSFPIKLCEIALERSGDQVEFAAHWLLEHGHRELERMNNETIKVRMHVYAYTCRYVRMD